jgi:hypothetical protein
MPAKRLPHRRIACCVVALALVSIATASVPLHGGQTDASSLIASSLHELELAGNGLQGPGADWLRARVARARYVALGEEHGIAALETLTAALWPLLQSAGFTHLGIEQGRLTGQSADEWLRSGSSLALDRYKSAMPPGVPSLSREHMAMLRALRSRSLNGGAPAPTIVGFDQERRPLPWLEGIPPLIRNEETRRRATALLAEARARQARGELLLHGMTSELARLLSDCQANCEQSVVATLDVLTRSAAVYGATGHAGNVLREQLMREETSFWRREGVRGVQNVAPRVFFRTGNLHAGRGFNALHVLALGNFLAEDAARDGLDSLHLLTLCASGQRAGVGPEAGRVVPCDASEGLGRLVASAGKSPLAVLDLEPLRRAYVAGSLAASAGEVAVLLGFDAVLVVRDATPVTFEP